MISGCSDEKAKPEYPEVELISRLESLPKLSQEYTSLLDSLKTLSNAAGKEYLKVRYNYFMGSHYYFNLSYDTAIVFHKEGLRISREIDSIYLIIPGLTNLAYTYLRKGDKPQSISYFLEAAELKEKIKDSSSLAAVWNDIGYIYWTSSNFDSAAKYFELALELRMVLPGLESRGTTINNLGTVYYNWGFYDKALDYFIRSLNLQREGGFKVGISLAMCNIGLVYDHTNQRETARTYYHEAALIAQEVKDTNALAYAYHNLANSFNTEVEDSALYYYNKALDLYRAIDLKGGIIIAYKGFAFTYSNFNQINLAIENYDKMLKLAISENVPLRIAEANLGLGKLYYDQKKMDIAQEKLLKALEISELHNYKIITKEASKLLSGISSEKGDIANSYKYLKIHIDTRDSLEFEETNKRLSLIKSKFLFSEMERDLMEKQIENERQRTLLAAVIVITFLLIVILFILLRMNKKRNLINVELEKKNLLIKHQTGALEVINKELEESNIAKDKLFSVIAHDLRSPFTALLGNTDILIEDYDLLSDSEKKEMIVVIQKEALRTLDLVDNLLHLSANRTGKIEFSPTNLELNPVLLNVIKLFESVIANKGISLIYKQSDSIFAFTDKSFYEIICRNLINNAIKYSNTGGKIEVEINANDSAFITTSIRDYGTGMDENTVKNLFNLNSVKSTLGTNNEKGTGLGLSLCKEMVEKQGGKIWVDSELSKGSTFYFTVPAYKGD
ncbi:MAG: tetratricopeptide repeat-containing sensor histidine kinase [Ignavibacteriaceae bacterium]|nr:tetratricopeptide repeat-containing sensor histidine kinase [Ignavibacteriaceae bacterium]